MDVKTIALGALGIGAVGIIAYRLSRPGQTTVVQGGGGGPSPQEMAQLAQQAQAPALQAVSSLQEGILGLARQYQQESASTKDMMAKMQQQTAQMIAAQTQTFGQALDKIAQMQTALGDKMAQQIASVISTQQQFQQQLVSQIQQSVTFSRSTLDSILSGFGQVIGAAMAKSSTTQPETTQPATTQPATTQPATTQPATTQPTTTQPTSSQGTLIPGSSAQIISPAQMAPGSTTTYPYGGPTVIKAVASNNKTTTFNVGGQNYDVDEESGSITTNNIPVGNAKYVGWGMYEVYDASGKYLGSYDSSYKTYTVAPPPGPPVYNSH